MESVFKIQIKTLRVDTETISLVYLPLLKKEKRFKKQTATTRGMGQARNKMLLFKFKMRSTTPPTQTFQPIVPPLLATQTVVVTLLNGAMLLIVF